MSPSSRMYATTPNATTAQHAPAWPCREQEPMTYRHRDPDGDPDPGARGPGDQAGQRRVADTLYRSPPRIRRVLTTSGTATMSARWWYPGRARPPPGGPARPRRAPRPPTITSSQLPPTAAATLEPRRGRTAPATGSRSAPMPPGPGRTWRTPDQLWRLIRLLGQDVGRGDGDRRDHRGAEPRANTTARVDPAQVWSNTAPARADRTGNALIAMDTPAP